MYDYKVVVIGGGIIGLCSAWQLLERGVETVVIDSAPQGGDNGARANAGMIVPSQFIPLAAPGMMAKGLRWLLDPESPFAIRLRPDPALARWGWLFHRHSTASHVRSSAALLRDLNLESRRMFAALADDNFFSPLPGPTQWLFQGPPAESKVIAVRCSVPACRNPNGCARRWFPRSSIAELPRPFQESSNI